MDLHKTNTRWLVHSWSTFVARTSHGQTRIHKTHHGPDLGEATTFPLILYFVLIHGGHILSRDSQVGVLKFSNLRLSQFWGLITFFVGLRLRWGFKQSYSPRQELSNGMCHATFRQGCLVDSQLLVVGNQSANLTPGHFLDHNLCFRYPNESCEPISYIYVPGVFQGYKDHLNPMSYVPYNRSLKIQKSTGTPTPKVSLVSSSLPVTRPSTKSAPTMY
jgi:hypothetical protein